MRPAVIVSLDVFNSALETVVICPLTTKVHPAWRSRLQVRAGGKTAEIAADQIRVVSKSRIGRRIGSLSSNEAANLRLLLSEMYCEV
jgi:mRNA interferase MazF